MVEKCGTDGVEEGPISSVHATDMLIYQARSGGPNIERDLGETRPQLNDPVRSLHLLTDPPGTLRLASSVRQTLAKYTAAIRMRKPSCCSLDRVGKS